MARYVVDVMPKPEILDPQGKAVHGALPRLGFAGVSDVRQGKRFEIIEAVLSANERTQRRMVKKVTDAFGGVAGKTVRIPIPQPTEERRKELVKKAHEIAEHARTQIRLARREANEKLKKLEKGHELGQDDERRALEEIQKLHDREIDEVAKVLEHKEKDIMTV